MLVFIEEYPRGIGTFAKGNKVRKKIQVSSGQRQAFLVGRKEAIKIRSPAHKPAKVGFQRFGELEENISRENGGDPFFGFSFLADHNRSLGDKKGNTRAVGIGTEPADIFILSARFYLNGVILHSPSAPPAQYHVEPGVQRGKKGKPPLPESR